MDLDALKLKQRSKELDAKEEYLFEREKILEKAPITFKVYEARIEAAESKLINLDDSYNDKKAAYEIKSKELMRRKKLLENSITQAEDKLSHIDQKSKNLEKYISDGNENLKNIKIEIKEREVYLINQNKLIENAETEGNERLLELKDRESELRSIIDGLESSKITLERQVIDTEFKLQEETQKLNLYVENSRIEQQRLENQLNKLKEDIVKASKEYRKISGGTERKITLLKEKEESITAKHDQIILERNQLETDKRRWKSQKSLYEV